MRRPRGSLAQRARIFDFRIDSNLKFEISNLTISDSNMKFPDSFDRKVFSVCSSIA